METIRQLLNRKGAHIWSLSPDATVYEAVELLSQRGIGALLVVDAGKVIGIVTERDYARKVILMGRSSRDTKVEEIMATDIVHVHPDHSVQECMELMTEKRVRHLPVLEEDKVLGIVSMGDLVKAIITEQRFFIRQLEQYITG